MIEKRDTLDGVEVWAGRHRLALFTTETDKPAIAKFIELCAKREAALVELGEGYEQAIEWNMHSNGKGKNWPVFAQRERVINQLCKEAGIVDT